MKKGQRPSRHIRHVGKKKVAKVINNDIIKQAITQQQAFRKKAFKTIKGPFTMESDIDLVQKKIFYKIVGSQPNAEGKIPILRASEPIKTLALPKLK